MQKPHTSRNRANGQFKHDWDYVGVIDLPGYCAEVGRCDRCGKYRLTGSGTERVMTRLQFERRFPAESEKM